MKIDNFILINGLYYSYLIVFVTILANLISKGCVNLPVWVSMFIIVSLVVLAVWRDKLLEDKNTKLVRR